MKVKPTASGKPFFLMVIVNCIDDILFTILDYLPHGSSHHVTSSIGSDGETMTLTCRGTDTDMDTHTQFW